MPAKTLNRLLFLIVVLIVCNQSTTWAAAPSDIPSQYRGLFRQYVDNRSITEKALNTIGFTLQDVGRSFVLVAGVSRYPRLGGSTSDLRPAREDVEKLAAYLIQQEFFDEVVVLLDQDVTDANLSFFLERYFPKRLAGNPKSRFLFAYSGHGITTPDGLGYLLTSEATSLEDEDNGIRMAKVRVMFDPIIARGHYVLALINACFSNEFHRFGFGEEQFLPKLEGAHVITAGGTNERSWADPRLGTGSIFFETLLAGIEGKADHLPEDGLIDVKELDAYITRYIKQFTDERQNPRTSDLRPKGSRGGFFFFNQRKMVEKQILQPWNSAAIETFGKERQATELESRPKAEEVDPIHPAQVPGWEKVFSGREGENASVLAVFPDGGLAIIGYSYAKNGLASSIRLTRLDAFGKPIWENDIADGKFDNAALAVLPDGGLAIAGSTYVKNQTARAARVARLDVAGHILWDTILSEGGLENTALFAFPDGSLTITANKVVLSPFRTQMSSRHAWAARIDPDGKPLWEKSVEIGTLTSSAPSAPPDGGVTVFGNLSGWSLPSASVARLHPDGGVLWNKRAMNLSGWQDWRYWGQFVNSIGSALVGLADGGYVTTGIIPDDSLDIGRWGEVWIERLNEDGQTIWYNTLKDTNGLSVSHLLRSPDGTLVIAGGKQGMYGVTSGTWIAKIDEGGRIIWQTDIGERGIEALAALPNNHLVIMHSERDLLPGTATRWHTSIARLNSKGQMVWDRNFEMSSTNSLVVLPSGGVAMAGARFFNEGKAGNPWIVRLTEKGQF